MSFFGKSSKTTVKTRPSKEVEEILRRVVQQTENEDLGSYIAHKFAEFTPDEQATIQQMADSGSLRQASAALSPRMLEGLDQMSQVNKKLGDVAKGGVTAEEVLRNKGSLQKGLYQGVQRTAASGGGNIPNTAAGRAAARRGASQQAARAAINPSLTNQGINLAQNKQANQMNMLSLENSMAGNNVNLGLEGMDLGNAATQNQNNVGQFLQNYRNSMNMNNFQNANSAALFPWESVNNRLAVLDAVSPMAGSTTVTKGSAVPVAKQIASAGIAGLSLYGQMGGFAGADSKSLVDTIGTGDNAIPVYKYKNQFNNSGGTGLFNRMGSWMGGNS
ncbi:hypothetical protein ABDC18_002871 [Escherichia coli]